MRWQRMILAAATVAGLFATGCSGPTPETRENRKQFDFLLTAITLKKPKLVEQSAGRIAARHSSGKISDGRYREILEVIAKAKAGDWPEAEKRGYEFRDRNPFFD
ncbi:MAG: hypothetical protein U0746_10450 [Gemmataceae bacterium]